MYWPTLHLSAKYTFKKSEVVLMKFKPFVFTYTSYDSKSFSSPKVNILESRTCTWHFPIKLGLKYIGFIWKICNIIWALTCLTWKAGLTYRSPNTSTFVLWVQVHFLLINMWTLLFLITPKLSYKTYTLNQIWNKFTTTSSNWYQLNTLLTLTLSRIEDWQ